MKLVNLLIGLLENDRVVSLENLVGALEAAFRRQAVHEDGVRSRLHHLSGDLEALEILLTLLSFVLLTHGRPNIGIDDVRALDSLPRIVRNLNGGETRVARLLERGVIRSVTFRARADEVHRKDRGEVQPRVHNVVTVTDLHYLNVFKAAKLFINGESVG